MVRVDCQIHINYSPFINDFELYSTISSTPSNSIPNTFTENMDNHSLKRKRNIKRNNRANRQSSDDSRNISHAIRMLSFREDSARTFSLPRDLPRCSPLLPPPAPILLPDNPKHLTDLYTDNRPATCLVENKRLVHQSVRVARFHSFTRKKVSLVCLACLLASIGQLAPRNLLTAYSIATSRGSFDPLEAETMLECAHCDVLIPLEDLARHKPRSSLTLTAELLSQVLAPQHLEQCCGRLAGELLREDDTKMSVAAVSEFGLIPSKTIDSLSGMPMPYLLICSIACLIIGGCDVMLFSL